MALTDSFNQKHGVIDIILPSHNFVATIQKTLSQQQTLLSHHPP
jgi:hypothetical protein